MDQAIVARDLPGVREYEEGDIVTIERLPNGRIVLVARAECGNRTTEIDLFDLIESLRLGPFDGRIQGGGFAL